MTVSLPVPVPLVDPPGSVAALGSVVEQLTSAGFSASLTVHLLEPARVLSGWQGADATVAAGEIAAALAVAADLHEAVDAAGARLAGHHELWLAVRARAEQLREEQRAAFAEAAPRLAALVGVAAEGGSPAVVPEARALVDTVAAADAARGAEHRALLAALADDAASAAALLGSAGLRFGGTGRAVDTAAAVTARLAVQLPGWGAQALADLGEQAADQLTAPGTAAALAATVTRWQPYTGLPGFSDALVSGLGPDGVRWLLSVVGRLAGTGEEEPLAALLAAGLGGAGPAADVVAQVDLDADDPDGAADTLALGMGVVLAAPGVGAALAAAWGQQLIARETARGARAGAAGTGGARLPDPVDAALAAVARSGDAAAAAALLDDPAAWSTLLTRRWPPGSGSLRAVVDLAAAGEGADHAARAALLALGEGLGPRSPGRVLDGADALEHVRGAVTGLVAGRPGVVLPVLTAVVTGGALDAGQDRALRGLGRLVAETGSAEEVTAAVATALRAGAGGVLAGAVVGAHVAVLEYGQRLQYALEWSRAQSRAVDTQMLWTFTAKPLAWALNRRTGGLASVVESVLAEVLDANGDVEIGPDAGQVCTADDAVRFADAVLGPGAVPNAAHSSAAAAQDGFARTTEVLGRLAAPEESWLDRLGDLPLPDRSGRPRRGH